MAKVSPIVLLRNQLLSSVRRLESVVYDIFKNSCVCFLRSAGNSSSKPKCGDVQAFQLLPEDSIQSEQVDPKVMNGSIDPDLDSEKDN